MELEKKISEMTEREILRKQLELLTEKSENCPVEYLEQLTTGIISICDRLYER